MTMVELEEELRHLEDMRRRIEALRETAAEYQARTAAARRDMWEALQEKLKGGRA